MTIQYTSFVGGVTRDVVRDTLPSDPNADEVVFIIGTTVETTQGYMKSRIVESALELADRFLNHTQYTFGVIAGLSKEITGANGIATVRANAAAVPLTEVAILIGTDTIGNQVGNGIIHETIVQIVEAYLETDGVIA